MEKNKKWPEIIGKIILSLAVPVVWLFYFMILFIFVMNTGIILNVVLEYIGVFIFPVFLISLIWFEKRKKILKIWGVIVAVFIIAIGINIGIAGIN